MKMVCEFGTRLAVTFSIAFFLILSCATLIEAGTTEPTAELVISDLVISPSEVHAGDTVTISINIENKSSTSGVYEGILKINGVNAEVKSTHIEPRGIEQLTFLFSTDTIGTYSVSVGSEPIKDALGTSIIDKRGFLEGSLTVIERPPSEFPVLAVVGGVLALVAIVLVVFLVLKRKAVIN